ncbi:MAG: transposase-like protein [Paraglaciecola sp.]|jgi:transposase-like protein
MIQKHSISGMKNTNIYAGYRYLHQIIGHAVWFYNKFTLSFRGIEELLSEKSVVITTYGKVCCPR